MPQSFKYHTMMNINRREVCRYMSCRGIPEDKAVLALVDEVEKELLACISPKNVYREFSLSIEENEITIGQNMKVVSSGLAKNLYGCEKVVLFAATLGTQADYLLRKYEIGNISKAAAAQAVGAAAIEAYCDELNEKIRQSYENEFFLKPRFSPGYGDFALEHQKDFFRLLEITKKTGITLSSSLLMIPTKSVTAVIGLTKSRSGCNTVKCASCKQSDCEFRNL